LYNYIQVGGVAKWLVRRSFAGVLSLSYIRSMIDRRPLCGWSVCYGSADKANSAFRP